MEKNLKNELISFVDEYNRVCERKFNYEFKDEQFIIITEGFITFTFMEMFMERFSDKGICFVIVYTGGHLEMIIAKSL